MGVFHVSSVFKLRLSFILGCIRLDEEVNKWVCMQHVDDIIFPKIDMCLILIKSHSK